MVYAKLMELMARLAELGLVHCDFNEFNVLVGPPSRSIACARTIESPLSGRNTPPPSFSSWRQCQLWYQKELSLSCINWEQCTCGHAPPIVHVELQ